MRIYLPGTTRVLRDLVDSRELGPAPLTAFAVTPGLRERYRDDDIEELEYAAMMQAARASLRLIDADPAAARRRVVLAADISSDELEVRDDLDDGAVRIHRLVPISAIASAHVDDSEAETTVAAAAAAIMQADIGGGGAQDSVDDAEGFELSWYATQEIATLLELS
jgi:hypothetical protein